MTKERILVWDTTPDGEGFKCAGCSWSFPNPTTLTKEEHDMVVVHQQFSPHRCDRGIPLRKFKW